MYNVICPEKIKYQHIFFQLQERQIAVTAEIIQKMNVIYFIIAQLKKGIFSLINENYYIKSNQIKINQN